ncbi:MAG: putative signal peptide protein [Nevskia sp.]|nr:putative signal peptide protein [Nevskia sp.]
MTSTARALRRIVQARRRSQCLRRRLIGPGLLCAALLLAAPSVEASENGSGNFAVGAQTVIAAYFPPPNLTEFYGYLLYYHAGSFRDDHGHSAIPDFEANILAQAYRVAHTWGYSAGGFSFSSSAIAETVYAKVHAGGETDDTFGIDLLELDPLHVNFDWGHLHLQTGPFFYLPVGPYDPTSLANSTTHYATFAHELAATWMPTPKWDVSLDSNVSFNLRNKATGYRSGDLFAVTYGVNYRPFDSNQKWQFGINGFYEQQFSDDHSFGQPVPTGARLRKFAVGPQAVYWVSPAVAVVVKWQHEMAVRNAPRGDLMWLECAFPL